MRSARLVLFGLPLTTLALAFVALNIQPSSAGTPPLADSDNVGVSADVSS